MLLLMPEPLSVHSMLRSCLPTDSRGALQQCTAEHMRRGAMALPWLPVATQSSSVMQHCDRFVLVAESESTPAGTSQGKQAAHALWP